LARKQVAAAVKIKNGVARQRPELKLPANIYALAKRYSCCQTTL